MSGLDYNLIHRFNLGDALRRSAARYPRKRAIYCMGRELTYAQFDQLSNRMARRLIDAGVGRGAAVAILALNSPEFAAAFFACARIGAVLVPVNPMLSPADIDFVLDSTQAKVLLFDPALEGKLNLTVTVAASIAQRIALDQPLDSYDGAAVECFVANEDAVSIIFTSGTTARPKGVVSSHLNWYATLLSAFADGGVTRHRRALLALPLFHVAGLNVMLACFAAGAEAVIVPSIRADWILGAIVNQRVDSISLPATAWVGLLRTPGIESVDFSCLKRLAVFQYIPTPLFQQWRALVPHAEWAVYWGQTETTPLGASTPPEDLERKLIAPDPIGLAHLPLEVRVADDDLKELPPGALGEFVVRGPSVTSGYLNDPEANDELFRGGWHHTGDMGYRDEEGYFYFVDRKKDMIKSGGENVSSQEVEEALSRHPDVAEAAVFGLPDSYWIELVAAAVVPRPGASLTGEALLLYARAHLAGFKAPKRIFIVAELPKNPSGKVVKRMLQEKFESAVESGAAAQAGAPR